MTQERHAASFNIISMLHGTALAKPFSAERIVDVRYWTPSLLSFSTTRPLELTFLPGQYARIALEVGDRLVWRAFSFVSTASDSLLEFVAVLVPGGLFTSRLAEMQPGDKLYVEHENYGFLTPDRFVDGDELWMVATGTGIGPFMSMLRDRSVWKKFRRIFLVRGVRDSSERIFRDELLELQKQASMDDARLSLIDCVSRFQGEASASDVIPARITIAWDKGWLETIAYQKITPASSRIMLCGNPKMIEDMRERLHARGMTPCRRATAGQFLTENYW